MFGTHFLCSTDACNGTAVLVWAEVGAEMNLHSCASPMQHAIMVSCQSQCEQRKLTKALSQEMAG